MNFKGLYSQVPVSVCSNTPVTLQIPPYGLSAFEIGDKRQVKAIV